MHTAYLVITVLVAAMVAFSGVGKLRRDPRIVRLVHEVVGVALKYFPLLAACELAGALGLGPRLAPGQSSLAAFLGTNARKRRGLSTRLVWSISSLMPALSSMGFSTVTA